MCIIKHVLKLEAHFCFIFYVFKASLPGQIEASLAAKNRPSTLNVRILNGQPFQVLEIWKQIALELNQVCKSIK